MDSANQPLIEDSNKPIESKRILAGVCAILLGGLGVHKFILGYTTPGIIMLVVTLLGSATICFYVGAFIVWIASTIGLIEGIIYLTKSDEEFIEKYQKKSRDWF